MPDVRLPDGTIVRNVPAGITQSELMRKVSGAPAINTSPLRMANIGPSQMSGPEIERASYKEVSDLVAAGDKEIPLLQRESFHEKSIPVLGGMAGLLTGGTGFGALAIQSLLSGAGAGAGELIRQQQTREPIQPATAFKQGAAVGAGNFAGGVAVKGLGAAAKKIFSTPLSEPQQAAAQFAKDKGAPFPLSSAAPGTGAAKAQQMSRALLPGDIRTQMDANKVTQFLNREVGTIVDKASPVDEASLAGQQYLRKVFEPGETVYTETFKDLRSTLGDDAAVPLKNTRAAMERVTEALKERGEMKSVFNRFRNVLKADAQEQTVAQLDELYSGILKDTARNANARKEANVVLSAIAKDIDAVAADSGMSFSKNIATAKAVRDQFRELRNIPQLERLSKPFGDKGGTLGSRQWMTELFSNPNGAALAELRTRNPELYHNLADSWLASNLNRFSKPAKDGFGRALDGQAFRAWYEQNAGNLKVILGAPQAKALDNFSLYAQHMAGSVDRSVSAGKSLEPMAMLARGGGEVAGMVKNPYLMIPGEAASFVIARGLSDPTSALFKVFTEGFSQGTRSFAVKGGQLAGQGAARAKSER